MKITRVAVLGVAVVAGVVAAGLALNLTREPAPQTQPQQAAVTTDLVKVLVAKADIPIGTTVTKDNVTWQDWPKTGVNSNYKVQQPNVDAIMMVAGSIARDTIYAGEPVTDAKLISGDQGFLSAILPEGMRAVATKIAADTSAGGFILPNDSVDVVMTRHITNGSPDTNGGSTDTYSTETILHNVKVLAIDQTIEEKDGEKVVVGQTATLELSPQQVEILSVAQEMSDHLTLSLRSIADSKPSPADAAADAVNLLGGLKQNGAVTVIKNGIAHQETALH